jgi:hypothetical protein
MKTTSCTEPKCYAFDNAPRCGARTKRNNGDPCRSPAVSGKRRCRIHGGGKGSGAQKENQNAFKHGLTTSAAKQFKKNVKNTLQHAATLLEKVKNS